MSPRTKKNLDNAMQCDGVNAAKYCRFAAQARMGGESALAMAFQEAADNDRTKHFAKESQLEALVATSPDNVREAIESEKKEIEMFAQFAREAAEDTDHQAAATFEGIRRDKIARCAKFEAILEKMGIHSDLQTVGS
jgi:rubrerythrin